MITLGLLMLAIGTGCLAIDWPPIYGGVPYSLPRHRLYEWIIFIGLVLLAIGVF